MILSYASLISVQDQPRRRRWRYHHLWRHKESQQWAYHVRQLPGSRRAAKTFARLPVEYLEDAIYIDIVGSQVEEAFEIS